MAELSKGKTQFITTLNMPSCTHVMIKYLIALIARAGIICYYLLMKHFRIPLLICFWVSLFMGILWQTQLMSMAGNADFEYKLYSLRVALANLQTIAFYIAYTVTPK